METKLSRLLACINKSDWHGALRIAAKFHDLGPYKKEITRAWEALQNPAMYRQMEMNPDALVAAGIEALKKRYL
jgi:hypothetical protein